MSSFPYVQTSNVFNTADYNVLDAGLTIEQANRLYLSLSGGTVIGNINTSNLTASSTVSASIINSNQYLLSGSPINFSAITGVSDGTATANKALILDGAKEISTLNAITSNTYYGITANIQFMNCDIMTSAINCNSENFYVGGTLFMNSTRDASNINTISFAGTKRIQDVSTIDFNLSSLLYKTIIRKSTVGAGIEFYDTQFSSSTMAMLSFICGNATSNYCALKLFQPYNVDDTVGTAFGQSFQIGQRNGPSFGGGMTICTTATGSYSEQDRINLAVNGGATPYVVLNPKFNQLHLFPQGLAELNTTYSQNVICGEEMLIRKSLKVDSYIQIGTSTDTSRLISALDSSMVSGESTYFTLGRDNSSKNQAEISFYYNANNSTSNRLDFGFHGGALMYLRADGRLGLNNSNPRATLDVVGTSTYTIVPFATNTYIYNVSNNTWNNLGGGPVSITIAAFFSDDIYVQNSVYTSSDRRLKENIQEIDIDIDRYKLLKPSSYNYKNQADKTKIGLIAQDVMNVCGEAITYTKNENMKSENIDEPEGIQLGMDYSAITVLNVAIIKKLIEKINILEEKLLRNNIQ